MFQLLSIPVQGTAVVTAPAARPQFMLKVALRPRQKLGLLSWWYRLSRLAATVLLLRLSNKKPA
ncbi:hypothetical protein C1896_06030 [Pseudomonadaceae bacterium SI-3]|nr:hypothetical protein C1896_06030 [Pseudomonadaceae bacterium SI-3]